MERTQNPPTFGSWGFDSPSRHQIVCFNGLISHVRPRSSVEVMDKLRVAAFIRSSCRAELMRDVIVKTGATAAPVYNPD
jgi:hypothetical protein